MLGTWVPTSSLCFLTLEDYAAGSKKIMTVSADEFLRCRYSLM